MTNLTEQWKKGELPDGMYYMENTSGIIGRVGHSKAFPCYNVKQILAPVPSYEEYNRLKEVERKKSKLVNVNYKIKQENQQLKDYNEYLRNIIKECEPYIENICIALDMEKFANGGFLHTSNALLSKIRTVIGEKK